LEKPPSAHPLLAHFHAGHSSRTPHPTGNGQVDTGLHHGMAFFAALESHLLERPPDCWLDGSGPHRHPATTPPTASSISLAMGVKQTSEGPRIPWLRRAEKARITPGFSGSASCC
jgi:hypothetical protein